MLTYSKELSKKITLNVRSSVYNKVKERSEMLGETVTQVINNMLYDTLKYYNEEDISDPDLRKASSNMKMSMQQAIGALASIQKQRNTNVGWPDLEVEADKADNAPDEMLTWDDVEDQVETVPVSTLE